MKVILNKDVKGLGKKLQTVDVSEGYARNFLLPRNIASIVDNKTHNETKTKLEALKYKKDTELNEAMKHKEVLEKGYIQFKNKVGENGKLFGSVTEKEISQDIKDKYNIVVDKKKITLENPIKELGTYIAKVRLYEGVIADLKINVVRM